MTKLWCYAGMVELYEESKRTIKSVYGWRWGDNKDELFAGITQHLLTTLPQWGIRALEMTEIPLDPPNEYLGKEGQ